MKNTLKQTSRLSKLWDDLLSDPVPPRPSLPGNYEPDHFSDATKPGHSLWKNSLETFFHTLIELETAEPSRLSIEQPNSEREVFSDISLETAHEKSLSMISPFRWEPKPAWINAPLQQKPPISNPAVPQRSAARPKIPLRPLHKQPFYKRFFFYLRRWLSRPK
jgi:hypothetical protein